MDLSQIMGAEMKRFLVTGSSRGLGLSIATHLAEHGCEVIMLARPSPHFEESYQHLNNQFRHVSKLDCDLSDRMEIDRTVRQIMDSNDRLDGVVFNAGVIHPISPILEANDTQWEENIHVNLSFYSKNDKGNHAVIGGHRKNPNHNDFKWCSHSSGSLLVCVLCCKSWSRDVDKMLS